MEWPPAWVSEFRPDQVRATREIVARFNDGARVVFLDAPTGTGKTLIGEMVRRELGTRGVYLCSDKGLQDQFLRDFDYARVLMGRANYPTEYMPAPYSADDCEGKTCRFCARRASCPYQVAKREALAAPVGVLNTAYFLAEANMVGGFGERVVKGVKTRPRLVVVDECDLLEGALMNWVEFRVSARVMRALDIEAPKKGARKGTVEAWIRDQLIPTLRWWVVELQDSTGLENRRRMVRYARLARHAQTIRFDDRDERGDKGAGKGGDDGGEERAWGDWIRQYEDSGAFVLKPVVVNGVAGRALWRHSDRWLCMSATIISAEEQARSLGLERGGIPWAVVRMPMRFARGNRQIVIKPTADVSWRTRDEEMPKLVTGIREILARYEGENVLVHTVSYYLTREIHAGLDGCEELGGRELLRYDSGASRAGAVGCFRESGGVLLAPSLERGIDLPDDLCRVVICAKMPFPSLGDRRVSERLRRPGGQLWYGVAVARGLVQMTGRGVRHEDDWAVGFVLDRQFTRWWKEIGRKVLPGWWREAITGDNNQSQDSKGGQHGGRVGPVQDL